MFRFTIRDLFWLTVVVALAVGWWANRCRLAERLSLESLNVEMLTAERDIERKAKQEVIALYDEARREAAPKPKVSAPDAPKG
jgi:hypothetical protein